MKNKKKIKNKRGGFTLIELLVVATIIVVLSAIGMVSFSNAGKSARNAKRKSDLETVRQALVLYKSDNGAYPTGNGTAAAYGTLVGASYLGNGYISNPTPLDPKDAQTSCGINGSATCGYTYLGATATFTLTAPLEGKDTYTLSNP